MKTRLTDLLGIRYPVIQASMAWITDAVLAAAVSKAGGLGTIGPNSGFKTVTSDAKETGERLREQIRKCKALTDSPFAVNFVVGVPGWDRDYSDYCVEVGLDEGVPVAIVSQGSAQVYTQRFKEAGTRVVQVCSTVRHAMKSQEAGVDAVIVSGTEGGGHSGFDQLTTLSLVPQAVDAVGIPVVAGGGIVDSRGLMAALALGAEGVYMGTRFMATRECPAHDNVKQALLAATDVSTIAVRHGSPVPVRNPEAGNRGFVEERRGSVRLIYTDFLREVLAEKGGTISMEDALAGRKGDEPSPESNRTVAAFVDGRVQENTITASQASGLIRDVPTCEELIRRLVQEASPIAHRLKTIVG
ncbi:MAG: nitronate monooxygenase [Proteobacteria bacterium]|nr:nitronate monooxygenase [Pseudomonadota bacterium]